ncbi:hypothetical protein [Terricaulis sp.]|uniref:hypothetical protein n=1 Tax=Terricaulis sp. TaxID=2768686 RepID=UPI003784560A
MKLKRGTSRFWAAMYRLGFARPHMPFWRVVVEAKVRRRSKKWPEGLEAAVAGVFVWARTIEEAEGLASLALEEEGLEAVTADAVKHPPAAKPSKTPMAMARTELGFLRKEDSDARARA